MPPTLFYRTVLFTKRSITRCLGHAGDRQIFNFTVSGAPGSTYQGRRHAAEALNGEAAKRPSLSADPRRRVRANLSLERSEKGPPLARPPRPVPKSLNFPEIRHSICVSALKRGLKRPPCQSVCECVCVCRFARVFRAETKNAEIRV